MGSGKTSTSTQQVSIPPEVLARYNAVNARAEQVAQTPFQRYTGDFVAPLTGTQQAGIYGTSAAANLAQPFYGAGAGMTLAGAQNVGPLTQGQIAYYENPYIESVARPTYQALRQQQQEEMMGQTANAIRSGAFGGDRAGLVAANLARQQQLGMAQAMAPIYAQGYGQAVQTAAGQQGVVAQDLARQMAAGQQIAGLGTGAQQAALQGAQAQLAAGTAEQQTQQADLTARYNQFLQEQGYPFQVAQFLANIAMGTGALSGSTTTTQQPSSFFSDRRLKDNVEEIGKLKDGQKLYRYTMADGRTHIGLMADEVEKKHPDAVGLAGGYKTVDYRAATDDAARHKKAYGGGLAPSSEGGAVTPDMAGLGFARGGGIDDIRRMLTMHREMYPYGHVGLYGNPDPRKGPYSSTMREINVPSRPLAPMTITVRPLNYAADVPAGVPQYASGGVVGYSQGGLPYSEASEEYVPEDISKPMTPASLKPAGGSTGPVQDPTVRDLMQMGRMAASLYSGMPFASGGVVPRMADGGPMDLDRVLAMQQQMYGSMGRPSGLNIPAGQARDPVKSMELMRPAKAPEPVKTGLQELQESAERGQKAYQMASGAYGAGKTALVGKAAVPASGSTPAQPAMPGLVGSGGNLNMQQSILSNPSRFMEWLPSFASGGVAGRLHYQDAGSIPNVMTQQDRDSEAELENRLRQDYGLGSRPVDAQVNNSNGQRQLSSQASEYINMINDPENINAMNENPNVAANLALSLARNPSSRSAVTPPSEDSSAPPSTIRIVNPGQNPVDAAPGQVVSSENNNQNDASSLTPGRRIQNLIDVFRGRYVPQYPAEDEYGPPQPDSQQESTVAPAPAAPAAPLPTPAGGVAPSRAAPAARTAPPLPAPTLPAPIEVGPVPGQGRQDVNEEVATTTEQPASGVAGASPLMMTQPQAPTQAPTQAPMSGGSGGSGLLGAVASENFLVPLLTGLGAMASSPSRYLGSALLQGLGAGAQAYENVKTKEVERSKNLAEIERNSYNPDTNMIAVYDENNQIMRLPYDSYRRLVRSGANLRLAPYPGGLSSQPSTVPQAIPAPAAPPAAPAGTPVWSGRLTQDISDAAQKVAHDLMDNPRSNQPQTIELLASLGGSPYKAIQDSATVANRMFTSNSQLIKSLADLGQADLTGPVFEYLAPIAQHINSALGMIGLSQHRIFPQQLADAEEVKKIQAALAGDRAQGIDQRSFQALQTVLSSIPGNINSPEGRAKIAATMMIANQRARDLHNFADAFRSRVQSITGSESLAAVSGRNVDQMFSQKQDAEYNREQAILSRLMVSPWPGTNKSAMSFIFENISRMNPNEINALERQIGSPGILRYFR
jgi:hypothetical protein